MELKFQLSKADLIKFYKLYLKDRIQRQAVMLVILVVLLIFALAGNSVIWSRFLFASIASFLIVWALAYYLPLFIILIRLNSLRVKNPAWFEQKTLTIVDEGIKICLLYTSPSPRDR